MKNIIVRPFLIGLIVLHFANCKRQVEVKHFVFNKQIDSIFTSISQIDSLIFAGDLNVNDTFIRVKHDSSFTNIVGGIMAPKIGKSFYSYYQKPQAKTKFEENKEDYPLYVSIIGDTNENSTIAYISLGNFFRTITVKDLKDPKTLYFGRFRFEGVYNFSSEATRIPPLPNDTIEVFLTLKDGLIAYKLRSGKINPRIDFNHH